MNPFDEYLDKLLDHLNILIGFLTVLDDQLSNLRNIYNQYVEKGKLDKSRLVFGKSLAIRDLTEWPANGWAIYYPSGKFILQGQEYLNSIEHLISRWSSWTISQSYEAFETFLKDITASSLLLPQADKNIIKQNLSKFKQKKGLSHENFEYWRDFTQQCYRKNTEILGLLRTIAPDIKEAEKHNNRAIDLTQWFTVVTEVRHAVVHSDLKIKNNRMRDWTTKERSLLASNFNGAYEQDSYILRIDISNANKCLTLFAEYAYTIYKKLSELYDYEWYDVLLKKRSL